MHIEVVAEEELKKSFSVKIPAEVLTKKFAELLQKEQKTYKVQGFRPGKVPLNIVKKALSDNVLSQAINQCISDANEEIVKSKNLIIAAQPRVHIQQADEKTGIECRINFELVPDLTQVEIVLPQQLIEYDVNFSDDDIAARITQHLQQVPDYAPIEETRPVQAEDVIKLDIDSPFLEKKDDGTGTGKGGSDKGTGSNGSGKSRASGKIGGNNGSGKSSSGKVGSSSSSGTGSGDAVADSDGSESYLPIDLSRRDIDTEFAQACIGLSVGDTIQRRVKTPQDKKNFGKIAGKEIEVTLIIKQILRKVPAVLDDKFAKLHNCQSVEEYRSNFRRHMETIYKDVCSFLLRKQVLDFCKAHYSFPIPAGMVKDMAAEILLKECKSYGIDYKRIAALPQKERDAVFKEKTGSDEEHLQASIQSIAQDLVRANLLFMHLAGSNNIDVTSKELTSEVVDVIGSQPEAERQAVYNYFRTDANAMLGLRTKILEKKVIAWIIDNATKEKKTVTLQEIDKLVTRNNRP